MERTGLARHHIVALVLVLPLLAVLSVDWVITGVTGERTFITDDAVPGPGWVSVVMTWTLVAACLALFVVLRREAIRFVGLGRFTRVSRRVLLVGLVAMAIGNAVASPLKRAFGIQDGPLAAISDMAALVAIAATFIPAVVIGLTQVRRNVLGLGGRLLMLTIPAALLTVAVALVADNWASPVLLTMSVLGGLSVLGAYAGPVNRPESPGRQADAAPSDSAADRAA